MRPGRIEMNIIAMMTMEKFRFTIGILPKKYPENTQMPTQAVPPNIS